MRKNALKIGGVFVLLATMATLALPAKQQAQACNLPLHPGLSLRDRPRPSYLRPELTSGRPGGGADLVPRFAPRLATPENRCP